MNGQRHGMMKLSALAELLGARLLGADAAFAAVSTDTRSLQGGELFIALQGPRFDAHDFIATAAARGACAALVQRPVESALPQVVVDDTRLALGRLAAAWREALAGPLVAVTGSWGKTTVKELLAAVLAARGPVLASPGNLNNAVGLPLSLLRLEERHRAAVVELGASAPGEIASLAALARPQVAVLTGAGAAHLEGFGSLEGVARAKGELLEALPEDGVAVLPADQPFTPLWRGLAGRRRVLDFGLEAGAVRAAPDSVRVALEGPQPGTCFVLQTPEGEVPVRLRLLGAHQVRNALAAAAAALSLGVDLEAVRRGLEAVDPVPGRLQPRRGPRGALVLDDSYNANPDSLAAALAVLAEAPGRRLLALGDMLELGPEAVALHRKAGHQARAVGVERLHALGPLAREAAAAFGPGGHAHEDPGTLVRALLRELDAEAVVLVKGSRGAGMERVVQALLEAAGGEG